MKHIGMKFTSYFLLTGTSLFYKYRLSKYSYKYAIARIGRGRE